MVWSEFWNELFAKCLQHCILAILVTITIVIFLLLCVGGVLGMDYLIDKQAQAKKKNREKNEPVEISDQLEEENE